MYCKPKTLISFLLISTIAHHLNCGSLSAKEGAGHGIYKDFYNLTETKTSRRIRSGALELNATNPNSDRIGLGRSKLAFPDRHEMLNKNGSLIRSFNKRTFDIDDGFQADTPGD